MSTLRERVIDEATGIIMDEREDMPSGEIAALVADAAISLVLEEAAKVADEVADNYEVDGWGHAACELIARRIRVLAKPSSQDGAP